MKRRITILTTIAALGLWVFPARTQIIIRRKPGTEPRNESVEKLRRLQAEMRKLEARLKALKAARESALRSLRKHSSNPAQQAELRKKVAEARRKAALRKRDALRKKAAEARKKAASRKKTSKVKRKSRRPAKDRKGHAFGGMSLGGPMPKEGLEKMRTEMRKRMSKLPPEIRERIERRMRERFHGNDRGRPESGRGSKERRGLSREGRPVDRLFRWFRSMPENRRMEIRKRIGRAVRGLLGSPSRGEPGCKNGKRSMQSMRGPRKGPHGFKGKGRSKCPLGMRGHVGFRGNPRHGLHESRHGRCGARHGMRGHRRHGRFGRARAFGMRRMWMHGRKRAHGARCGGSRGGRMHGRQGAGRAAMHGKRPSKESCSSRKRGGYEHGRKKPSGHGAKSMTAPHHDKDGRKPHRMTMLGGGKDGSRALMMLRKMKPGTKGDAGGKQCRDRGKTGARGKHEKHERGPHGVRSHGGCRDQAGPSCKKHGKHPRMI